MNEHLRTFLLTLSREAFEPWLALKELAFPAHERVTLLEKLALARKDANDIHIANPEEDAAIIDIVRKLSEKMHLKTPKIVLYHTDKNQQAMHINNNTLALAYEKIESSTPDELRATIAHELAHQRDNSTSVAVSIGRLVLDMVVKLGVGIATHQWLAHLHPSTCTQEKIVHFGVASVAGYGAGAVTQVVSEVPYAAFRRSQELHADAVAGEVVGFDAMESVLEKKIARDAAAEQATHHPHRANWAARIVRSHPSNEKRLAVLEALEQQQESSPMQR